MLRASLMTMVTVKDRDGSITSLVWSGSDSLMEALRTADYDVAGTCGGACSCGTCHVYVGETSITFLPAVTEDEADMLEALSDVIAVRPCSRLACQLRCTDQAYLTIEIAPQP